jgi:hypothetical protein
MTLEINLTKSTPRELMRQNKNSAHVSGKTKDLKSFARFRVYVTDEDLAYSGNPDLSVTSRTTSM